MRLLHFHHLNSLSYVICDCMRSCGSNWQRSVLAAVSPLSRTSAVQPIITLVVPTPVLYPGFSRFSSCGCSCFLPVRVHFPPLRFFNELQSCRCCCAWLGALIDTEANARSELTRSGCVARAVKFVAPIPIAVGHAAEEVLIDVLFILLFDGEGVSLYQPAAKASRVRFSDNGEEPSRRGLYAAQELVRSVRAAATLAAAG